MRGAGTGAILTGTASVLIVAGNGDDQSFAPPNLLDPRFGSD